MTEEELLALLKGISGTKPPSPAALLENKKPADDLVSYMAPSAAVVLAGVEGLALGNTFGAEEATSEEGGAIVERFASKAWKSRQDAFTEAKAIFEGGTGTEPFFREIAPLLAAAADDNNASANDAAVEMIIAW